MVTKRQTTRSSKKAGETSRIRRREGKREPAAVARSLGLIVGTDR
jgi:hypothetical protein